MLVRLFFVVGWLVRFLVLSTGPSCLSHVLSGAPWLTSDTLNPYVVVEKREKKKAFKVIASLGVISISFMFKHESLTLWGQHKWDVFVRPDYITRGKVKGQRAISIRLNCKVHHFVFFSAHKPSCCHADIFSACVGLPLLIYHKNDLGKLLNIPCLVLSPATIWGNGLGFSCSSFCYSCFIRRHP